MDRQWFRQLTAQEGPIEHGQPSLLALKIEWEELMLPVQVQDFLGLLLV